MKRQAIERAIKLIAKKEGFKDKVYYCSEQFPTIGHGFRIGAKHQSLDVYQFTLPRSASMIWLKVKIEENIETMQNYQYLKKAFNSVSEDRQVILISMMFQLGVDGVSKFVNMLTSLLKEDYPAAEKHALDSKWFRQTKSRALHHAKVLRTGELID